jgi:hypothetical protein
MIDEFPLAPRIPMHLLAERGLNEAFLDVVGRHHREGLPVVVRREGRVMQLPAEQLTPEVSAARTRIAELTAEIADTSGRLSPSTKRPNEKEADAT